LVSLLALPLWAVTPADTGPASGLIVVLRGTTSDGAETVSVDRGPWATGREQAQAAWGRRARADRERVTQVAREAGVAVTGAGQAGNAQLLRLEKPLRGEALAAVERRLRLHPDVLAVVPDVRVPLAQVVPNDPGYVWQWHLQESSGYPAALNMPAAWARTTGSADTVVALVDSGVRFDHPDLAGRLLAGYDLVSEVEIANDGDGRDADASDPGDWITTAEASTPTYEGCEVMSSSWHGTFIAGQLGAVANNATGVAGVNWNARILPVRVSGKCGALLSDLLDGMRWAAGLPVAGVPANPTPARVINLSFGGSQPCDLAYQSTIDAVTDAGALVVVAAGNGSTTLTRPADCQRVMPVTAVRTDGAKADYASFGAGVALAAPGGACLETNAQGQCTQPWYLYSTDNAGTTTPGANNYWFKQGTSFAAPLATGVASLMLAINHAITPAQLMARMQAGVRPHTVSGQLAACGGVSASVCNCTTTTCGAGLLDAERAVALATGPAAVIEAPATVEPGSTITLNGLSSAAIPGSTVVAYAWQQLEGPTVVLATAQAAQTAVTLTSQPATYVFRLQVTDSEGRTGEDTVQVVTVWPEGGGGSMGWAWGLGLWVWVLVAGRRSLARR
jgi:serine protease